MNTVQFFDETFTIKFLTYTNGRKAIQLVDEMGCPMCVATVNMPEVPVAEGNVLIKNWSENKGMLEALITAGIVGSPVNTHPSGHVTVPECPLLVS